MLSGKIHSIESLGAVDGPGLRFVVFFAGCPMRCAYCHNPDTWSSEGQTMTAREIIDRLDSVREFLRGGGLTCTGGEPLMQPDFCAELFELAKKEGIHTCLDTSGATWGENTAAGIDRVLVNTDLVMLDIKHIDPAEHKKLTGFSNEGILRFAQHTSERGIDLRIRHVLVPGITDSREQLFALGKFIGGLKTLRSVEVLPYHTLGVQKYQELGIAYRLKDTPPATKAQAAAARDIIFEGIKTMRENR